MGTSLLKDGHVRRGRQRAPKLQTFPAMHEVMEMCSSDVGEDTASGDQNVLLANQGGSANAPRPA